VAEDIDDGLTLDAKWMRGRHGILFSRGDCPGGTSVWNAMRTDSMGRLRTVAGQEANDPT
jgi:hypothetical protein